MTNKKGKIRKTLLEIPKCNKLKTQDFSNKQNIMQNNVHNFPKHYDVNIQNICPHYNHIHIPLNKSPFYVSLYFNNKNNNKHNKFSIFSLKIKNNNNKNTSIKSEKSMEKYKVAIVGSGNWGSVAAKLIASNTLKHNMFHDEVRMWVFDETLPNGELLSNVINQTNENVKYLPGIQLGKNVVADPDIYHTVRDANMLVFVTPHQFVEGVCKSLVGKIKEDVEAISLIKGMEVKIDGPRMVSSIISKHLGRSCCVLMGANIADEIAKENFTEATIGFKENREVAERWARLFSTPYFVVAAVQDVEGVELCGTLKNVVAIAAGFVDGLNMGNNTKAAIMRIGLNEMRAFSKRLCPSVKDETFFESCGVADLIATCFGGRNRKVAEAFAACGGKKPFEELEAQMLQGQKLQGVLTAKEVYEVLGNNRWLDSFPLFRTIHDICIGNKPVSAIVHLS